MNSLAIVSAVVSGIPLAWVLLVVIIFVQPINYAKFYLYVVTQR